MIYIAAAAAALAVTLAVFGMSDADVTIQNFFYDPLTSGWLLDKKEPIARLIFYTGPKVLIILFGVCCLVSLIFSRFLFWASQRRRALIVILLSLITLPSLVGALKYLTNVACPTNLTEYGGSIPHVRLFDSYPQGYEPEEAQRCFPAGHASGGYALLSLVVLFSSRRAKIVAASGAFLAGTMIALYKMAVGDHSLSHSLVTLELGIILVSLITLATFQVIPRRIDLMK